MDQPSQKDRVLYCNCTYAKVIPQQTKQDVLRELSRTDIAFEAVADLCEMSARGDEKLKQYASCEHLKIVACYPRAVKWLFHAAGAPLNEDRVEFMNMREQDAEEIVPLLVNGQPSKQGASS